MNRLPLTQGGFTLVDDDVFDWAKEFTWNPDGRGYVKSCMVRKGEAKWCIKHRAIALHQLIIGRQKGMVIDHINRNKLDNRRENLRHVTQSLNAFNGSLRNTNSTGIMGVSWCKDRNRWRASIVINGKQANRYFRDFKEAIEQRKAYESLRSS